VSLLENIRRGIRKMPPKVLLYGGEGIGKSSWASDIPGAIFLSTENGLDELDCESFPKVNSYREFLENLEALQDDKSPYRAIVIDTMTNLERLIQEYVCSSEGGMKSIEVVGGGYGKGYTFVAEEVKRLTLAFDSLHDKGWGIFILAHSKAETFNDPEGPAYDRWSPRLHKKVCDVLVEWASFVGYASMRKRITEVESGGGKTKNIAKATIGKDGPERYIRFVGGPSCVAKQRGQDFPGELPLRWSDFENATNWRS